jgi:hypothetical protein
VEPEHGEDGDRAKPFDVGEELAVSCAL